MNKAVLSSLLIILSLLISACSGGSNPVRPQLSTGNPQAMSADGHLSQTHLWGFYDIYIDIPTKTVTAIVNRQAMFTANVVNFINSKPSNLGFHINDTPVTPEYIDVDIDVTISHPFPGLTQYNGYDIRGVFMGDGSATLKYNPDLIYPVLGTDQFMLADPDDQVGGPDGYTRWFNKAEFSTGGMPLFQYTPGKLATPDYSATATLNPCKYYADGLGAADDLWAWLQADPETHGVFSAGTANTRNYYLRFPNSKGVKYSYAILANWEGTEPQFHPSNAPESVACKVTDTSNVYYAGPSDKGGELKLEIGLWNWDSQLSAGVMEDYKIFIESTVLTNLYEFSTDEMTPIGGGEHYSTYSVEIPADNIQGNAGNEYWIIVEQQGLDYTNDFGVTNLADTDPLAAIFRCDLAMGTSPTNADPDCVLEVTTAMPVEGFAPVPVSFDASGSSDPDGDPITFEWDFDGDGVFGEDPDDSYTGSPAVPTHGFTSDNHDKVYVKVKDNKGGESVCSVNVVVTTHQSKNIPLRAGVDAIDLGVDPSNGDLWIIYSDREMWKYTLAAWYQDGTNKYTAWSSDYIVLFMDIASGGYCHCMLDHAYLPEQEVIYDCDGNKMMSTGWGGVENHFADNANFSTSGDHANDLIMFVGYYSGGYDPKYVTMLWGFKKPYTFYPDGYYTETYLPPGDVGGIDKVFHEYVQGMDTGVEGTNIWFLEAPDYYCAAFRLDPTGVSFIFDLVYNDQYFGTGTEQTGDTCWTANVCDLARTPDNRFHVLDNIGGVGVIKVFTGSATGGTSHGHYGDAATLSGAPLKLDGSDSDGNMVVLHGSASTGYFISIFMPSEMP